MKSELFECKGLFFSYPLGNTRIHALKGVNLSLPRGELTALAGPSGSGKSTLLNLLGLIEPVQEGTINFDGTDISMLNEKQRNHLRRSKLGFVFQNFLLFDTLTAAENVAYFLKNLPLSRSERRDRVAEALEEVGLADQSGKRPLEMSGGQRQRVAIARALAKQPAVILADEPTASLDQATGERIMSLFQDVAYKQGTTVLYASHDPMAISFAKRLITLKDGIAQVEIRNTMRQEVGS